MQIYEKVAELDDLIEDDDSIEVTL